ncbi:MAG: acyclic terpene utilization AtuA family protein [Myxococcales bacterium]|nr:MAG: acyclic terpene utilization AtuA family protein [Myxococcales bacterium]
MKRKDERKVVLGGAAGAWGDTSFAAPQLLDSGRCDYILFEALAEITMGILTRARLADPSLGYTTDVIQMIGRDLPRIGEQGVRVVTNAGGVNPRAAATLLQRMATKAGVELRIAWIEGDNLVSRMSELGKLGLAEMSDGSPLVEAPLSFNAYLGAWPIAAALDAGADIVITGRCVDSALALGPLIHEFGWGPEDLDALAQGSLAGHLLECGPQSTGGLLTDWEDVPMWHDLGYPLAECRADGSFVLTKPEGTGGLVDVRTVSEQLLYEIGDPSEYLLPDVTCDWRYVDLAQVGPDRVEVTGARGKPPPPTLMACAQVVDGYKVLGLLFIGGRDAAKKAKRFGNDFIRRAERLLEREGFDALRDVDIEILGAESTYGPHSRAQSAREVVVKIALHHDSREALSAIVRELGSFGMAVPGLTAGGRGLPKPTPPVRLRSYLVPRERLNASIHLDGEMLDYEEPVPRPPAPETERPPVQRTTFPLEDPVELPLIAIAHARSGDKGADANIGVRARHPDFVHILREQLTEKRVAGWLAHRIEGSVRRYEVPGIQAFNFVLRDALGGGGISSLRFDPQGKAYAQQLLDIPILVSAAMLAHPALVEVPEVEQARERLTTHP